MNNASDATGFLGSNSIGGFGYGIGVSVGILLLITTITLASYFCTRNYTSRRGPQEQVDPQQFVVEVGLDDATIRSYPKLQYSEAKQQKKDAATCCSVCLGDYKTNDTLRQLPDCGHLFHPKCIDPWLRINPTCPVCRTSPLPTPLSTPLAEVAPLAGRRD